MTGASSDYRNYFHDFLLILQLPGIYVYRGSKILLLRLIIIIIINSLLIRVDCYRRDCVSYNIVVVSQYFLYIVPIQHFFATVSL